VNASSVIQNELNTNYLFDCARCGSFYATDIFIQSRGELSQDQLGNACGWIREHQGVRLVRDDWESLKSLKTPSVGERAEKFLLYLSRKYPNPNQGITFYPSPEDISVCWATNKSEATFIYQEYLFRYKKYLAVVDGKFVISPAGWDYLHSLNQVNKDSQIGFCAMWFDDSVTQLWVDGIEPAINNAGYKSIRIDKHQHNNRIDDEIISVIRRSKFVVADFTGNRGGVYFEAGFALGLGLQVIWTVREDELKHVHFDNRQYSFLKWTNAAIADFRNSLQYRIEATIGRGPIQPIND